MGYSDGPNINKPRIIGCGFGSLLIVAIVVFFLFMAALGHCAPDVDGTGCENEGFWKLVQFPGSAIVGVGLIILLARWAQSGTPE